MVTLPPPRVEARPTAEPGGRAPGCVVLAVPRPADDPDRPYWRVLTPREAVDLADELRAAAAVVLRARA